jgi:two-component system, sensor histidine kinase PdtaS
LNCERYKTFLLAAILLWCASLQLHAQYVLDDKIDSLQKLLNVSKNDTAKVKLLIELEIIYRQKFSLFIKQKQLAAKGLQLADEARALSEKTGYQVGIGRALLAKGKMLRLMNEKDSSKKNIEEAYTVFTAINDKAGLASVYLFWAEKYEGSDSASMTAKMDIYKKAMGLARAAGDIQKEAYIVKAMADEDQKKGRIKEALEKLLYVLNLQKRTDDRQIHYTTDLLAHVYRLAGNYNEALKYAMASVEHSRQTGDTIHIVTFYQRLGGIYKELNEYGKAQMYYEKALADNLNRSEEGIITIALIMAVADMMIAQDKNKEALEYTLGLLKKYPPADESAKELATHAYYNVYFSNRQFKQAEKYCLQMLANQTGFEDNSYDELRVLCNAGKLYYELKQIEKSAGYSKEALQWAIRLKSPIMISDCYLQLFRIDSLKGNYISAIRHYQQYDLIKDSLFNETKSKQIAQLDIEYKTEQKEKDLQLLGNQNQLQQTAIKQGKSLRNTIIAGAALLLLLLFLVFNRYQVKQRANKLLQAKQEKINQQNQSLENLVQEEKKLLGEKDKLLEEKEWLMKEIHHRVKNNLQIVMSLLNSQSAYLKDDAALLAIRESQHRVHAISLIHQKLYQSENLSVVDMAAYIKDVVEYLADNLDAAHRIRFSMCIGLITLDVAQAVPIGLIINEAVTNSVKYAFPGESNGEIEISMQQSVADGIVLYIKDNGIGLPVNFNWQHTQSLGMSLMLGLSKQLDGKFEVINNSGLTVQVKFMPAQAILNNA